MALGSKLAYKQPSPAGAPPGGVTGIPGAPTSLPAMPIGLGQLPNVNTSFADFSGLFGPPKVADPMSVARDIQSIFSTNPQQQIIAPTITPAQIAVPGGTFAGLQNNIFESQFRPVQRELTRQSGIASTALMGALGNAGLAESGAGIGAVRGQARDFEQRTEDAARDISASAAATRYNAEIGIAIKNAELTQQARLAEAGFDVESQRTNSANILAGNSAAANGYMSAMGLSAEQANSYRNSFLSFFDAQTKNKLASDASAFDNYANLFNLMLQGKAAREQAKLEYDKMKQQRSLAQQEMQMQRELAMMDDATKRASIAQTGEIAAVDALKGAANPALRDYVLSAFPQAVSGLMGGSATSPFGPASSPSNIGIPGAGGGTGYPVQPWANPFQAPPGYDKL